jgi:hypothetical protein
VDPSTHDTANRVYLTPFPIPHPEQEEEAREFTPPGIVRRFGSSGSLSDSQILAKSLEVHFLLVASPTPAARGISCSTIPWAGHPASTTGRHTIPFFSNGIVKLDLLIFSNLPVVSLWGFSSLCWVLDTIGMVSTAPDSARIVA